MEQKMNRAIRACLERSGGNPICSIHDQGAGGNGEENVASLRGYIMKERKTKVLNLYSHFFFLGNVLKELSEPAGAVIYCSRFKVITT